MTDELKNEILNAETLSKVEDKDSLVFVDDNPAERHIISGLDGVAVPELGDPETYINILDRS